MISRLATSLLISFAFGGFFSPQVHAEDKPKQKRQERRALKMDDYDSLSMADKFKEAAHQKNKELMKEYEKLLKDEDIKGERKAVIKYRLAEKYFDEGRYHYYKEMQAYEKKFDDCFNTPKCDTNKLITNNKESKK